MKSFIRILGFVWPYRRRLALSIVFAGLVAVLWSMTILLTYPVMKVLLNDQTVEESLNDEIEATERELAELNQNLDTLTSQLEGTDEPNNSQLRKTARGGSRLGEASWKLFALHLSRDHLLPLIPNDRFETLTLICVIIILTTLLRGAFRFVQETLVGSVVERTIMDLRKLGFRRTLALDLQTIRLSGTPDLMSRFTYDMTLVAGGLTVIGARAVREPLKAAGCIFAALLVNWQLTLLSLVFVPPAAFVFHQLGRMINRATRRVMESMSRLYKVLEESFDGARVIIAFNNARHHRRQFHRQNREYYAKAMKIVHLNAATSPIIEALGMVAVFFVLLPGTFLVCRSTRTIWGITLSGSLMDFEQLATMYALLIATIDPVRKLANVYAHIRKADAAANRVFELLDRKSMLRQPAETQTLPRHDRSIEFRGVGFSHLAVDGGDTNRPPALVDVDLRVETGELIMVVGENGSGKSTLVNLLPRFYDADRGAVLIDDVDIRDASLAALRDQIGLVSQETVLFDDTIHENIRYGNPHADLATIRTIAETGGLTSFVNDLPDGFETRIGEKGRALSGGQRQRIALARAMIRNPSILILDEATSAVDAQSERLIYGALEQFIAGRTTFMVTHSVKPRLLGMISRIAVMERGRLIAVDSHDNLLQTCPVYQKLFNSPDVSRAA